MIGVVLITHGQLGQQLVDTVTGMLGGLSLATEVVAVHRHDDPDERAEQAAAAIKRRKQLGLIINLLRPDDPDLPVTDRLSGSRRERDILEVAIPEITLPVAPGHNLAVLVEAACRDHLLRQQGHRSDEIFAARQAAHMQDGAA